MLKRNPSASVLLDGETQNNFDTVKNYIEVQAPGIRPNNADVMRHALHLAADTIIEVRNSAMVPPCTEDTFLDDDEAPSDG